MTLVAERDGGEFMECGLQMMHDIFMRIEPKTGDLKEKRGFMSRKGRKRDDRRPASDLCRFCLKETKGVSTGTFA